MGSNREKSNIAIAILDRWRIWAYPISHFKGNDLDIGKSTSHAPPLEYCL